MFRGARVDAEPGLNPARLGVDRRSGECRFVASLLRLEDQLQGAERELRGAAFWFDHPICRMGLSSQVVLRLAKDPDTKIRPLGISFARFLSGPRFPWPMARKSQKRSEGRAKLHRSWDPRPQLIAAGADPNAQCFYEGWRVPREGCMHDVRYSEKEV